MSDRPSFLIYKSFYEPIKHLSDEDLGRLFRAIFELQSEDNKKQEIDISIKMAFSFFKNQFDLDEKKYDKRVQANRVNGLKGGRPNKPKEPNGLNGNPNNPSEAKKAYKEKEKGKGKDIKKNIKKKTQSDLIDEFYPNEKSQQSLRDKYPKITKAQANSLIENFKDQMYNRGAAWKDIQSCFRNYLSKDFIKIPEPKKIESFTEIGKIVGNKQKPLSLDQLKKYALEVK